MSWLSPLNLRELDLAPWQQFLIWVGFHGTLPAGGPTDFRRCIHFILVPCIDTAGAHIAIGAHLRKSLDRKPVDYKSFSAFLPNDTIFCRLAWFTETGFHCRSIQGKSENGRFKPVTYCHTDRKLAPERLQPHIASGEQIPRYCNQVPPPDPRNPMLVPVIHYWTGQPYEHESFFRADAYLGGARVLIACDSVAQERRILKEDAIVDMFYEPLRWRFSCGIGDLALIDEHDPWRGKLVPASNLLNCKFEVQRAEAIVAQGADSFRSLTCLFDRNEKCETQTQQTVFVVVSQEEYNDPELRDSINDMIGDENHEFQSSIFPLREGAQMEYSADIMSAFIM